MPSPIDEFAYAATQASRVAWYMAHLYATQSQTGSGRTRTNGKGANEPRRGGGKRGPGQQRLLADMAALFARELGDFRAGRMPWPRDHDGGVRGLIGGSRRYFDDLPEITRRRDQGLGDDLTIDDTAGDLPEYYLRNFHYQTDGYLTDHSARLYDTQVEILFGGAANAMRRRALLPITAYLSGRDQRRVSLLDAGCGTGRFLRIVKDGYPRLKVTGLDLSDAYLGEARRHLRERPGVDLVRSGIEDMPLGDASFDLASSIFLFHELPPEIRRKAAAEIARVLKPGGVFVLMDSLQLGDVDNYDALLEGFDGSFHEPYYRSYLDEDFIAMFSEHALVHRYSEPAFLSKAMVFDKTA